MLNQCLHSFGCKPAAMTEQTPNQYIILLELDGFHDNVRHQQSTMILSYNVQKPHPVQSSCFMYFWGSRLYLMSTSCRRWHKIATNSMEASVTSEPDTSRISHELSARATSNSSHNNLLRLAIANNLPCKCTNSHNAWHHCKKS